jgi:hypothetical protein
MGQPGRGNARSSCTESIGVRGERGEVKHLSTPRKRNQIRDSLSSGERTGKSPNSGGVSRQALPSGSCGAGLEAVAAASESYQPSF